MFERAAFRSATVFRIYLIVALFIAIILCLVLFFRFQLDASVAIRTLVGGEGLWAKAHKDAIRSLDHYTVTHDEAEYRNFLRMIDVPLGDRQIRLELRKPAPDPVVVRKAYLQGHNHPADMETAVAFYHRFQHTPYLSRAIGHWAKGDVLIVELCGLAEAVHTLIASRRAAPGTLRPLLDRIEVINNQAAEEEDLFSSSLTEASRRVDAVSRKLTYSISLLFIALGAALSWPIIRRIRTTEADLRQSEEKYRNISENANDMIFTLSREGVFLSLNAAFERVTGWPRKEWIGKEFAPLIHPDDLRKAFEMHARVLSGEWLAPFELRFLTKSGEYSVGEYTGAPIKQGDRTIGLGIMRDVTERRSLEETLRESEQRFRIIFNHANDGILLVDTETRKFFLGNDMIRRMLGYGPEEFKTLGVADIHPEKDLLRVIDQFERQRRKEFAVAENLPVKRKDGTVFYADISSAPVTLGKKTYLVGIFRDITERKKTEERMRLLNEELGQKVEERTRELLEAQQELIRSEKLAVLGKFAGSVGHELRNPLGVMKNAVYYLRTVQADADETTKEYLTIINDEISGAERIVSDLLDSIRVKAPRPVTIGLRELVSASLEKCKIPENVTLALNIPEALLPVKLDPFQMTQVFINLVRNGVDAMPEGGSLEIAAVEDSREGVVRLGFRDTGAGIAPENMARLFEPLFTTKSRGVGLGLVVVKNLTEANGGRIEVKSAPGKGTVFTVLLPVG